MHNISCRLPGRAACRRCPPWPLHTTVCCCPWLLGRLPSDFYGTEVLCGKPVGAAGSRYLLLPLVLYLTFTAAYRLACIIDRAAYQAGAACQQCAGCGCITTVSWCPWLLGRYGRTFDGAEVLCWQPVGAAGWRYLRLPLVLYRFHRRRPSGLHNRCCRLPGWCRLPAVCRLRLHYHCILLPVAVRSLTVGLSMAQKFCAGSLWGRPDRYLRLPLVLYRFHSRLPSGLHNISCRLPGGASCQQCACCGCITIVSCCPWLLGRLRSDCRCRRSSVRLPVGAAGLGCLRLPLVLYRFHRRLPSGLHNRWCRLPGWCRLPAVCRCRCIVPLDPAARGC